MWEELSGLYGLDESEAPWIAKLLSLIIASQPNIGSQFRRAWGTSNPRRTTASPWEELQDIIKTAQEKETTTHPFLNPFIQQLFPEYIVPQQFGLADIAGKMEAEVPGATDIWKSIIAGRPQELLEFPFQTRPGEIFRPELPARVRAPEVMEKKASERIDRFIKEIEAGDFLKARDELQNILKETKYPDIPFQLFKALPEGFKKTMWPERYPAEKAEKPPAAELTERRNFETFKTAYLREHGAVPLHQIEQAWAKQKWPTTFKEEKPAEWTGSLESAYQGRDMRLEGHMTQAEWKELRSIGKPISELPNPRTLLQRNQIVSELGKKKEPSEKNALLQEMKMSLENERDTLEGMGIDVNYLLKYLNTFRF